MCLATAAADRRAAHARLTVAECAVAHISHLTICCGPGERLEDQNAYAVQIGYCEAHNVNFSEIYRGGDYAEAERVMNAHNAASEQAERELGYCRDFSAMTR